MTESAPWDRMGRAVEKLVRADPRIAALHPPLRFTADEHQVVAHWGPLHEQRRAALRGPEWWGEMKRSRAERLASVLIEGLLAVIEAQG